MTTTVTVKTHTWPVAVTTEGNNNFNDPKMRSHGYSSMTVFVPANSSQDFAASSSASVTVRELPEDATDLNYDQCGGQLGGAIAANGIA